jgi:tetratricopeptide (TPR) repeat protein
VNNPGQTCTFNVSQITTLIPNGFDIVLPMKLRPRQKKELLAIAILIVLTVSLVIYQGILKKEYMRKMEVPVLEWSPEQSVDDFRREISNLEKNADAEKCFSDGVESLRRARTFLDRNLFQKARKDLECADNAFSTYSTVYNLALCLFYLEDFSRAGDLFLQAAKTLPSAPGAESFLGLCLVNTGRWKEGMNILSSALKKARDRRSKPWEAVILSNIGVIYKHTGNPDKAEKYHDLSLALCRKIGYRQGEAAALINLAHLTASRGEIDRALRIFDNALALYRKIDDGRGEASTLGYIARLYKERRDIGSASKFYNRALTVSRRAGYRLGAADTLVELGDIAYRREKRDQAISHYLQAEESYRQAGFPEGTSALAGNLGFVYKDKKKYKKALEYYNKALLLDRSARYLHGEAYDLSQIGSIHELIGESSKALDAYKQAKDLFQSLQLDDRVKEMDNRIQAISRPASAP